MKTKKNSLKLLDWVLFEWAVVVACQPRHRKRAPPGMALARSMARGESVWQGGDHAKF